jgi:UDP-N-acetyl-2-amino-2-deoxyglucuronate dehydrogenase
LARSKSLYKWAKTNDYIRADDWREWLNAEKEQRTFRSITINNQELEFSTGFTDLHTESYEKIMKGEGFGILDAQKSIQIVHDIRNSSISTKGDKHPLCVK